jgi:hypothetical protein
MFQKHDVIKRKLEQYFDGIDSDEYVLSDRTLIIKDYLDDKFRVSVKHAMCKYFYSLPFDYVVLFPLPYVALPTSGPIKISEEIELIKIAKDFKISYTPPSWSKLFKDGLFNPPKSDEMVWVFPKPQKAYVLVKVQGASVYASINKMCKYATRQFKILVAAMYSLNIIGENDSSVRDFNIRGVLDSCLVTPVTKPRKMLHDEDESAWIKLSPLDWDFIRKLDLNDQLIEPSSFEKEAMERLKKADTAEEQLKRFERILRPVRKVLIAGCPDEQMTEIERVKRALLWFFNGLIAEDESFSFIQLTIAVEALLGVPKGSAAMTERIADRLTFLIAEDAIERRRIKKNFQDAYEIRSKIVHEGKASLDKEDKVHYYNLKFYTQKALAKEIEALPDL